MASALGSREAEATRQSRRILFVDAYDSFAANIAALLQQCLHARITMIKIDDDIENLEDLEHSREPDRLTSLLCSFDAVVIGPGPGHPNNPSDIGLISRIWGVAARQAIPVLGICLGFQSLCSTYGLSVSRLPIPCHGHAKEIIEHNEDIFHDVGMVVATSYNSLGVKIEAHYRSTISRSGSTSSVSSSITNSSNNSAPAVFSRPATPVRIDRPSNELQPLAWDTNGYLMAVKHRKLPFRGLQFHPESCKSNLACQKLLMNWWKSVAISNEKLRPSIFSRPSSGPALDLKSLQLPLVHKEHLRESTQLLGEMLRFTETSGPFVQSETLNTRCSSQIISEICRQLSPRNTTAMLESTKKGRYSIYAMPSPATMLIEHAGGKCILQTSDGIQTQWDTSATVCLDIVEQLIDCKRAKGGDESSPFWGGFVGFFSYEIGLDMIKVSKKPTAPVQNTPDISLVWTERTVVVDELEGIVHLQSIRKDDRCWIEDMAQKIVSRVERDVSETCKNNSLGAVLSSAKKVLPNEGEYKSKIEACQAHLRAGNSYELCLTSEAQITLAAGNSWLLYKNLRRFNPVPFAAYVQLGKTTILSSSPEQFCTWDRKGTIDMIPMKGTVKKSPAMTFAKASQILSSPKESAENLMIADLIRHDLYSAVGWGADVSVIKLCEVIEHETVYQLVSYIRAKAPISPDLPPDEQQRQAIHYGHRALRQSLPPGSMTGAPKKRSCEILSELEHRPRGVYSGVLGYLDVGGGGGFSVCIRTAFSSEAEDSGGQQTWRIGAGGAITVLSDVDAEWQEMQVKLESVLRAFRPE